MLLMLLLVSTCELKRQKTSVKGLNNLAFPMREGSNPFPRAKTPTILVPLNTRIQERVAMEQLGSWGSAGPGKSVERGGLEACLTLLKSYGSGGLKKETA